MKPLPVAPWTTEDTDIWLRWAHRYGWWVYACFVANVQTTGDRRDADRMHAYTHKSSSCERCLSVARVTAEDLATLGEYIDAVRAGRIM